jgi:hypothetical protein
MPDEPLLRGEDESTPIRALNRTALVVLAAALVIGAVAYALWSAFA